MVEKIAQKKKKNLPDRYMLSRNNQSLDSVQGRRQGDKTKSVAGRSDRWLNEFLFACYDSRLYKPKYLALMVAAIWISGFGALIATWFGHWGRFGLDPVIGSCSILPDEYGRSPKEFLFILAFLTPCLAIVVCYARIFYIVRRTALRSRRNKVSRDLTKSNLEVRYTKGQNFEDSAIGSSCVATVTTTENGSSPTRHEKLSFIGTNSPRLGSSYQNFEQSQKFEYVERGSARLDSSYRRSSANSDNCINKENGQKFNDNIRNSSVNLSAVVTNDCNNVTRKSHSVSFIGGENKRDEKFDDNRGNVGTLVTPGTSLDLKKNEANKLQDSVLSSSNNNLTDIEKTVKNSSTEEDAGIEDEIPFIDSSLQSQNVELGDSDKNPTNFERTKPQIRFEEVYIEPPNDKILTNEAFENPSKRPLRFEENSLQVPRRFQGMQNSSESLINSQISRYDEISEDFVSSRSDSPSEKRSCKKSNIFRRESRFRSTKTRQFETGKLNAKDKKLLKMILVIFASFLICYLPITISKTFRDYIDWRGLNIAGYILIYLTTCINPIIYVVMSSEYRSAYKNVLLCRSDSGSGKQNPTTNHDKNKKYSK